MSAGPNAIPADELNAWPGVMLLLDSSTRVIFASSRLTALTGVPAAGAVGCHLEALFPPGSCALLQSSVLPVLLMHGGFDEIELELRCAGGVSVPVLVSGCRDGGAQGGGRLRLVLLPARERRRDNDELVRIQRAADESPAMLFDLEVGVDGSMRLRYVSEAVLTLYGCTPQAAQRSPHGVLDRIDPRDLPQFRAHPEGVEEARHRFLLRVEGPPAWAWHEVHAVSRLRSDGSVRWSGQIADVTDRQQQAEELAQLHMSERSRATQYDFIGRIGHEMRMPLNAIVGFAQLLHQTGAAASTGRYASYILDAGRNLLDVVNELLDISRLRSGALAVVAAPLDLREPAQRAIERAALLAQQHGIELTLADGPPLGALADGRRLAQVLDKLLSNAIRFNRPQGRVQVTLRPAGEGVAIAVSDTGHGLDEQQLAKIFQPFHRVGVADDVPAGVGLGLCIVNDIVQAMGGSLEVDSAPGVGSSFRVVLRPAALAEAAHQSPRPSVTVAPSAPRAVLYAEDNPVNAILMCEIAARVAGAELVLAEDAASALAIVARRAPDLLLIDRYLRDADGVELLAQLRQFPDIVNVPAVMVCADARPDVVLVARAAGFSEVWPTPLDLVAASESMRTLLGSKG